MNNKYSVDYANKTVRQLPDMVKPDRSNYYISSVFHDESEFYANDLKQYEYYVFNMPIYPCPTMPESWRKRETVEAGIDFKFDYEMKIAIPMNRTIVQNEAKQQGDRFIQGYICAVVCMIQLDGVNTYTREMYQAGIGKMSLKQLQNAGVADHDLDILKKNWKELNFHAT